MALSILNNKWLMRLFVAFSTFLGFCYVADMHSYMPLWKAITRGLFTTCEGHLGLWLAMFQIQNRIRFLAVLLILAPLIGLYVLWYELHPIFALASLLYTVWILFQTIKGKWV